MFYRTAHTIYNNGNCNYKFSQLTGTVQLCASECLIQPTQHLFGIGKKCAAVLRNGIVLGEELLCRIVEETRVVPGGEWKPYPNQTSSSLSGL